MRRAVTILVVAATLTGCLGNGPAGGGADTDGAAGPPTRTAVVSASHPLAAAAGAEMLRRGGNAFDAAAAVQFALNVVEPPMSGIGGGAFLVAYVAATGELVVLDGREKAPAASTPDQFLTPAGVPQEGLVAQQQGFAVGVPGTLMLFATALDRYGTMGLADVLGPGIRLAEEGFAINEYLAADIAGAQPKLERWPASAEVFLVGSVCPDALPPPLGPRVGCAGGRPLQGGETLVQADLAATFRRIADEGIGVLYGGAVGQAVVDAVALRDGRMTLDDLVAYDVEAAEPVVSTWRGLTLASPPPPSSSVVVHQTLALLEPLGLAAAGADTADAVHLTAEAMRLAYADARRYVGDPAFVDVPLPGLLDAAYIEERRTLIDASRANPSVSAGEPPGDRGDDNGTDDEAGTGHTTHFTIVDGWGDVVAVTTTIESAFGSGMVVPGHGFLLNNELTDFDFEPGGANQVEAGKRPRSWMSPTIVLDDDGPLLALGSPGGGTIPSTVLQVLLNVMEHGMDLDGAVAAGRILSTSGAPLGGRPSLVTEGHLSTEVMVELVRRGHNVDVEPALGNVQAVQRGADGAWSGAADTRANEGAVVYVAPGEVAEA